VSTLALDLGSTRIKLARLSADGGLAIVAAADAPRPRGDGALREFDADEYRHAAESLAARIESCARLGLASQRSTFVLWDRASGAPVTPAISWQDRRAAAWCDAHAQLARDLGEASGLPLSPHYAGPKLAVVLDARPELRERMRRGEILFGTLETYLVWHWSERRAHETDLSMAARTLLVDVRRRAWSESACEAFGVPSAALPKIVASAGRDTRLTGEIHLACSIADQASGLLAMLPESESAALVNLGTGCFVLRPTGASFERRPGYLAGPLRGGEHATFALEGTILIEAVATDDLHRAIGAHYVFRQPNLAIGALTHAAQQLVIGNLRWSGADEGRGVELHRLVRRLRDWRVWIHDGGVSFILLSRKHNSQG